MLMNQPFFIPKIEDVGKAKGNAFGAAALFFFIFLISIVHLIMDSMNSPMNASVRTVTSAAHDESVGGWSGQRQNGDYGQVPTFEGFEDNGGMNLIVSSDFSIAQGQCHVEKLSGEDVIVVTP